ncbi:GBF-interacting protein 1-like [Rosa chinensis]|uniref:GBF-interacting protein 1-like n=1 Tax=Rosa chinensis TaxID=74649 RepID=UPI000D08DE4A|nr:GBF-interacting protein 1-like [Rosa chinensis]
MSGGGETRVSIPDNVHSTIQNIREITKKLHSDDEIYAVLKECSMDPNETAQKLLYLDTFHEVKKRRDRRKENLKGRASEDLRTAPGAHRRMVRGGGQGNYSSDAGGGRNSSARRENGASHVADGGSLSTFMPGQQKTKNNAAAPIAKASIGIPNGIKNLSNGTSSHVSAPKSSAGVDANKLGATAPRYAVVVASTPVVGLKDQRKAPTTTSDHLPNSATSASDSGVYSSASDPSLSTHIPENKDVSGESVLIELSKSENVASKSDNHVIKEKTQSDNAKAIGKNRHTKLSEPLPQLMMVLRPFCLLILMENHMAKLEVETVAVKPSSQLPPDLSLSDTKLVTFPNHIKVPESLRNVLTFGSINSTFGTSVDCVNGTGGNGSTGGVESSQDTDETAKEPSPSNNSVASSVQGDFSENPLPSPDVLEKLQTPEGNVSSESNVPSAPDSDSKRELLKQDLQLPPEVPHNLAALNGPSYSLGFLPPMLGGQVLQVEGHDNQAPEAPRVSNFGGNSVGVPSPNTTPPLPSSIAASPQIPVFRHAYPANYFPYGYLPPYYLPPMHQFLSPNGFPPQPSAYLPPTAPAAAGIKYPPPQFKAGSNAGNPPQYNIQSGGSFITTPAGYAPGSAVTSGSSVGNTEDLGASQSKESHIYTTGQLTEGSTVWIHTPGQDISSLYNLPQGQRFAFSPVHAGHGAMTGLYPPGQTMASPTYLQQSQAAAGAAETIGPPPAAYQQPQHAQMNWNSSF